jgi:hypothetical protein
LTACVSSAAQAQDVVGGLPVPPIIKDDPAAAALFPHLIGLRTAELCLERGEGISAEQMETLTIALANYAEILGISSDAEDAVRGFASTIVDRQAEEMSRTEWKRTKCARLAEIFAPPAIAKPAPPAVDGF